MVNYAKTMMAVSIAGLVLASYGGEFTLKKADYEALIKARMLAWEMSSSGLKDIPPQVKLKVPDGMIEPKLKYFFSSMGAPIPLLVYKSSKEAKTFDRVIIDQAVNRDFTDDPVLTFGADLPVDVKIQPKGGDAADYRIYIVSTPTRGASSCDVALLPALWREGTVTLAGKPVRAVMQNMRSGRRLMIDRDETGRFNLQSRDWLLVATYVKFNNAFYKAVLGSSDNDLDFEPYNGPFGKLELTGEMVPRGNNGMVALVLGGASGTGKKELPYAFNVKTALTNQPIVIPAGEYGVRNSYVIDQGKNGKHVSFNVENKVVIRPDQVTTLNLGQPKADLSIVQQGRKLTVNRVMVFAGNPAVTYSMAPEGRSEDQKLAVDVVDAADPTKIIVGRANMEYG
jgi:hypothetical protein